MVRLHLEVVASAVVVFHEAIDLRPKPAQLISPQASCFSAVCSDIKANCGLERHGKGILFAENRRKHN